jgi:hypothetical protein
MGWRNVQVLTEEEQQDAAKELARSPVWKQLEEDGGVSSYHVALVEWLGVIVRPHRYQSKEVTLGQELPLYGTLDENIRIRRDNPELLGATREICGDPNCKDCSKHSKGKG